MDRTRALYLLSNGPKTVAHWNSWRSRGEAVPDLPRASFVRLSLLRVNLSDMDLELADFSHSRLIDATFRSSTLKRARFHRAMLDDAVFEKCDLTEVNFHNADLDGARLVGAHLLRVNFERANLCGADLREAVIEDCRFKGVECDARTQWPEGFDPGAFGLTPWPD